MEAYKVGINLSLVNGVSSALALIARDVMGLDAHVSKLIAKFNTLSATTKMAVGGGVAIAGAVGLGEAYKSVAEHGKDLLSAQSQLLISGLKQNEILKMTADYYEKVGKAVPTGTVDDYLKNINELRTVGGTTESAVEGAPWALKLEALIKNATGRDVRGTGFNLYRAAEMRGTMMTDPEATSRFMNGMAQNIMGSGGKLTPETYLAMAKRAGGSWLDLTPEYINGALSVVAADMGGDTAGTASMSLSQFLMGSNTMSQQQYDVLNRAHLIDPNFVRTDKGGHINVMPGGIIGSRQGISDPYSWVKDTVAPAVEKMSAGDKMEFTSFIGKIARNRNVFRLMQMFSDPGVQQAIEKDRDIWGKTMGVNEAYASAMKNDPKIIEEAYNAQKSMMEAIGAPLMQAAIPVMRGITSAFTDIGNFATAHKGAAEILGGITMALSGLLGAVGVGVTGAAGVRAVSGLFGKGSLTSSAIALNGSAAALTEAAIKLGGLGGGIDALTGGGKGGAKGFGVNKALQIGAGIGVGSALLDSLSFMGESEADWKARTAANRNYYADLFTKLSGIDGNMKMGGYGEKVMNWKTTGPWPACAWRRWALWQRACTSHCGRAASAGHADHNNRRQGHCRLCVQTRYVCHATSHQCAHGKWRAVTLFI